MIQLVPSGRAALLIAVLTTNCGPALAQKVTLLCSGTLQSPDVAPGPINETIVVDYGLRTVNGPIGSPYPFTSLGETKIEFSTSFVTNDNTRMIAGGKIDRVSGDTTIMIKEQKTSQPFWIFYALSCRPSRPAF